MIVKSATSYRKSGLLFTLLLLSAIGYGQKEGYSFVLERTVGSKLNEEMQDAIVTSDGGIVAVGIQESAFGTGFDGYLVKIDPQGKIVFRESFGSENDDRANAVAETPFGQYLIAGSSRHCSSSGSPCSYEMWLNCREQERRPGMDFTIR